MCQVAEYDDTVEKKDEKCTGGHLEVAEHSEQLRRAILIQAIPVKLYVRWLL